LVVQRRLTIGGIQISEGRRLVGFAFEARMDTISGIQIPEGLRLVVFQFEARKDTISGIQIPEGLRLVEFEFEARRGTIGGIQISEGLDSQFHCSYLESRGVPVKNAGNMGKKRGKLSPFHFR
jgi:hypothetical protein